ncbi:MAG: zinc ribbon domain-containing protein [Deltaproteobacteria bacterium]|nr:MAG: zinc ribbon domain-containing protein [Deltaproteobacteria bacterium]
MPIYEYLCRDCGRKSTHLVLRPEGFEPTCRHCGGRNMKRLISRVAFLRSEEERLERLADPDRWGDLDERDPRSFAKWMKEVGKELGEDVSDEVDQIVEEALEGEGGEGDEES